MKSVKVLLFSNLRVKAGTKEIRVDINDQDTVEDVLKEIVKKYPALKPQLTEKIVISIDHKIVDRTDLVPSDSEMALLPPVGGG